MHMLAIIFLYILYQSGCFHYNEDSLCNYILFKAALSLTIIIIILCELNETLASMSKGV